MSRPKLKIIIGMGLSMTSCLTVYRHLLLPLLFQDVTSLHFRETIFPLVIYTL